MNQISHTQKIRQSRSKDIIASQCDKPNILSVYRGLMIAHAAHRMAINRIELGYVSTKSVLTPEDYPKNPRAILKPHRLALLTVWQHGAIEKLLDISSSISKLPDNTREDLGAFLKLLRKSRIWYDQILQRAPRRLALLEKTVQENYWAERKDAEETERLILGKAFDTKIFTKKWPEVVFYDEQSKKYRELINETRGLGQSRIDRCLDGENAVFETDKSSNLFDSVAFGQEKQFKYDVATVSPLKYAMRFWERRHKEGMAALAKFAIERAIVTLK